MEGLLEKLHPKLPYLMILVEELSNDVLCWMSDLNQENSLLCSGLFFWIRLLFKTDPPRSFMDKQWLRKLKFLIYTEETHKIVLEDNKIPEFGVKPEEIQTFMNDKYPEAAWLFVYDDCKTKFNIVGSDPSKDTCEIITFLRILLTNVTHAPDFIDMTNLRDLGPLDEMDVKIHQFILNWLYSKEEDPEGPSWGEGLEEMDEGSQAEEVEEEESDDSKGKEDI